MRREHDSDAENDPRLAWERSHAEMTTKQRVPGRRASALGLALLVALAFGAFAASGAQALDWQHPKPTVLSGSESVAGTGSGFTIVSTVLGSPTQIQCSSASTSGSIVGGGTGTSTIGLSGCSVSQPSGCSLASPLSLSGNLELVEVSGVLFQKFVSSGEGFGNVEFTGAACPFAGIVASLKGSFAGRELSSAMAANHSVSFNKEKSGWPAVELKLGKAAATIGGEVTQHLSGSQAYHAWRGIWQGTHGGWEEELGSAFSQSEALFVSGGPVSFNATISGGTKISFSCSEASAGGWATIKPGGSETLPAPTFSGCKVESPSNCTLLGNKVQFESVTGTLTRVNGAVYEKFTPSNPEGAFMAMHFEGSLCPIAGTSYEVKGSFAGLGPEFAITKNTQPLEFSKAANEATGSQMTLGMYLSGSIYQSLSLSGPWGAF
jgi:hypothetical protein